MQRHSLLAITNEGRERAFKQVERSYLLKNSGLVRKLIVEGYEGVKVPGIIRRAEEGKVAGKIAVGFSSPMRYKNSRLRIPAFISERELIRVITPYEVMRQSGSHRTKCLKALQQVKAVAQDMKIKVGIWGSCALEVCTGLPYTDEESDLDLLIGANHLSKIEEFYKALEDIGKRWECKIDLELNLPIGYDVKVAELFRFTEDVLGKNRDEVRLIPRENILNMLKIFEQ